ncbi:GreA/GreB family elongation factor [Fibrella sp. WM1]|uniref:GreA/GreB family elongation factor n=1 Tax=Fibrella musci TaxID=3242485 RepID=UPI0035208BF6
MSRAFLKNETADDPVVIPARAPLPPNTPNYVTPRGLNLLRAELTELEAEHARIQATGAADDPDRTRQLAELNGRVGALNSRIASARLVEPQQQPTDEVRFGATVTLRATGQPDWQLTIVGVDEANASQRRIAFTAPVARLMQGKRLGETVTLRTPAGERTWQIAAINYESDS